MKKYMIEMFVEDIWGRSCHRLYECESFTETEENGHKMLRIDGVNTYAETKTGKIKRKQLNTGKLIPIELLPERTRFGVWVWENNTDKIVKKWGA